MKTEMIGPFIGMSYKGRQIVDKDIKAERQKSINRVKFLATETEGTFDEDAIIVSSGEAFEKEWQHHRNTKGDIVSALLCPIMFGGLASMILGLGYYCALQTDSRVAALAISTLAFMLGAFSLWGLVVATRDSFKVITQGFDSHWRFGNAAGNVWYLGEKALHVAETKGWYSSHASTSIFYDEIGTVRLSPDTGTLVVAGRNGQTLASIPDPVGRGQTSCVIRDVIKARMGVPRSMNSARS